VEEERSEEESVGHEVCDVACEEWILNSGNESFSENDVRRGKVAHGDQGHGGVKMIELWDMVRGEATLFFQGRGLEVCSVLGEWP